MVCVDSAIAEQQQSIPVVNGIFSILAKAINSSFKLTFIASSAKGDINRLRLQVATINILQLSELFVRQYRLINFKFVAMSRCLFQQIV